MKIVTPLIFVAFILLSIFSCEQKCPDCPPIPAERIFNDLSDNKIPLDTAVERTGAWRKELTGDDPGFLGAKPLKAYTIPHQDIAGVIKSDSARVYLSIDSQGNYRLTIVGVDTLGNDKLDNIYDFTQACPPFCDTTSVLN